ncbi:MAG: ligase-associated DNA damage response endonuclease PdeM [Pseudomonadota bacterium]
MDTRFTFVGQTLTARPSGALWWAAAGVLAVADLHFGRSERLARRGGTLLPPYDTAETLARLTREVRALAPRTIVCLGDSFDDLAAANGLDAAARATVSDLAAGRRWIWVAGNHDPADPGFGGEAVETFHAGPLCFRHIAARHPAAGEVSGHYHPKLGVPTRAGHIRWPCFLWDDQRIVLPAFGTYTGGLSARDPALRALFPDGAEAILTGRRTVSVPVGLHQSA